MALTRAEEARRLHSVAVLLENDAGFYERYKRSGDACRRRQVIRDYAVKLGGTDEAVATSSEFIVVAGERFMSREYLRRYFDMRFEMPCASDELDDSRARRAQQFPFEFWLDKEQWPDQKRAGEPSTIYMHPNSSAQYRKGADGFVELRDAPDKPWRDCARSPSKMLDGNGYVPVSAEAQPQPQPAQEQPTMLKITTKTLINDVDIAKKTDDELFEAIAQAEAEIAKLEAINAKPKALVAKIKKLQAGIAALVAHMDSKV